MMNMTIFWITAITVFAVVFPLLIIIKMKKIKNKKK